jgi:7-cyano-7-deazaguanine synthase
MNFGMKTAAGRSRTLAWEATFSAFTVLRRSSSQSKLLCQFTVLYDQFVRNPLPGKCNVVLGVAFSKAWGRYGSECRAKYTLYQLCVSVPGVSTTMHADAQTIVLLSGGMDSAACAHYLQRNGHTVCGLFVDYGQKAAGPEERAVEQVGTLLGIQISRLKVLSPQSYGCGEIPGRNAFLIFSALMTFGHDKPSAIAMGIHGGTPYYDCSPAFVESISRLVSEYTDGRTRVIAPFVDWVKQEVFEYCAEAKIPIELTYSCEAGEVPPCGFCVSCRDRRMLSCLS